MPRRAVMNVVPLLEAVLLARRARERCKQRWCPVGPSRGCGCDDDVAVRGDEDADLDRAAAGAGHDGAREQDEGVDALHEHDA